jgi:hypothetical protein
MAVVGGQDVRKLRWTLLEQCSVAASRPLSRCLVRYSRNTDGCFTLRARAVVRLSHVDSWQREYSDLTLQLCCSGFLLSIYCCLIVCHESCLNRFLPQLTNVPQNAALQPFMSSKELPRTKMNTPRWPSGCRTPSTAWSTRFRWALLWRKWTSETTFCLPVSCL